MGPRENNPVVQRRRLRLELREIRIAKKLTQQAVASAMDWSTSKLVRMENGEVKISPTDARVLLLYYGIEDQERFDSLVDLARASKTSRWSKFRCVHSPEFLEYVDFEMAARNISGYDPLFLPGLLQTEAYAREILTNARRARLVPVGGGMTSSARVVELRWLMREQRQTIHDLDDPPDMCFILTEGAIRQQVGGPETMRLQLKRLLKWQRRPHVTLRVLPYASGAYRGIGPPFMLLGLVDDDVLLYLEDLEKASTHHARAHVDRFVDVFDELKSQALCAESSGELIAAIMQSM